jgi:hypothetical protein
MGKRNNNFSGANYSLSFAGLANLADNERS